VFLHHGPLGARGQHGGPERPARSGPPGGSLGLIKNGGSLLHLGELLGHARLSTTERYVATIGLRLGELRAAIPSDIVP
jgi:hypothetical protein